MSRLAVSLAFSFLGLLFSAPALAQTGDLVRLADGSFFRGTIVESTPERVVITLPTGESRAFARADVISAGPEAAPVVAPTYAPRQAMARVRVTTEDAALSLHGVSGTASLALSTGAGIARARIEQFDVICNLPCDVELPAGAYQLALAEGTGTPVRTGPPVTLREGDNALVAHYDSRQAERIGGWLTWTLGLGAGAALVLIGYFVLASPGPMILGAIVAAVGLGVGLPLAGLNDQSEIVVRF